MKKSQFHAAKWQEKLQDGRVLCTLCPRYCKIGPGQNGFCYIRQNIDGQLYSIGYGRPTGFAVDPIEKKPLYHFYPGSEILSFGTAGCNLGCKFCQNWNMSKAKMDEVSSLYASPADVVSYAKKHNVPSIAFTYNDPIIFGEYVIDVSRLAKQENIKTVMVTNGYIDKQARKEVFADIDAANVDLKAFTEKFYHKLTYAHLQDVLDTLVWLKNETEVWIEVTTLLIPGENDSAEEISKLIQWILENLGTETPLHFSAFHPAFKMMDYPSTNPDILNMARDTALEAGIKYCYTGNIYNPDGQTTYCPQCETVLIKRDWHSSSKSALKNGCCPNCITEISGCW